MMLKPSKNEIFLSLATGIYFAAILPLQVLVANSDLFNVQWSELIKEGIVLFVLVSIISCLVAVFLNRLAKGLGGAVILSLLVCIYLESGVLSIGIPSINGGLDAFSNPWRKLIDSLVWGAVFCVGVLFRKYISRFALWGAGVFVVMSCAMIFDAKSVSDKDGKEFNAPEYCSAIDVINAVEFSPGKNVFFLILDGFPASVAKKLVTENPELCNCFQGFTAFDNNIGMHSFTSKGVPGLLTGKFQNEFASKESVAQKIYGEDSFLRNFMDAGYEVFFSHSFQFPRYASHHPTSEEVVSMPQSKVFPAFQTYSETIPYINLAETMLFRIVPYGMKVKILANVVRRLKVNSNLGKVKQERFVYEKLSQADLSTGSAPVFISFHTTGVHEPIGKDRYGNPVKDSKAVQNPQGVAEQGYFVLAQVSKFMKALQTKGVYEKSFIVITSDHGTILMRDGSGNHGAESALLWVKPIGAGGGMVHSNLSTSHCKVAEMMRRVAKEDLSIDEVKSVLHTEQRHFIATKDHAHWWTLAQYYEWVYDESGNLIRCEKKKMK